MCGSFGVSVKLLGSVGVLIRCDRAGGRVQKGVGFWAPMPWKNVVCFRDILADAVDSKPDGADIFHGILPEQKITIRGFLVWSLLSGEVRTRLTMLEHRWVDPQAGSQKDVRKEDCLQMQMNSIQPYQSLPTMAPLHENQHQKLVPLPWELEG